MPTFSGVITFEILANNCLNGHYTNDHPDTGGQLYNEIARKISEGNGITGQYICSYIDVGNIVKVCTLEIREGIGDNLLFSWNMDGTQIFKGIGLLNKENRLRVEYTDI